MSLFQINEVRTRKAVPGLEFSNKMAAKRKRHELNEDGKVFKYYVAPGPSHRRYRWK